jgi:Yip1 domain
MSSEVSVSTAPEDDDDVPVGLGERVRRALAVPGRLLEALLLPDRGIPRQVTAARYGAPLVAVFLCGLIGAAAVGSRLDVSTDVLADAARGPGQGGPGGGPGGNGGNNNQPAGAQAAATKSDREIAEDMTKKLAVERVVRVLKAGALQPLKLLVLTFFVWVLLLYVGGSPTLPKAFAATTHAALPQAVKSLVLAGAALMQSTLTPAQADALVDNPLAPAFASLGPAGRLFDGVDPFFLWSLLLLGLGMASAGEVSRKRAFITLFVGTALFLGLGLTFCGGPGGPGGPGGNR